jgi:hypothetical protein
MRAETLLADVRRALANWKGGAEPGDTMVQIAVAVCAFDALDFDPLVTVEKVRDWAISKPADSRWWECGLCGEIWPEDGSDEHHENGCPARPNHRPAHARTEEKKR